MTRREGFDRELLALAGEHGTPLFILDHRELKANYRLFKEHLPRVQCYYAVKANSDQEIVKTLFEEGSSFDVASYNEFMQVYDFIKDYEEEEKDFFIWDKIIFSNTIKDRETLRRIRRYRPLVTYDNIAEIRKIKDHCDTAGLVLRLKVPDAGSQVEMGSKFGCEPGDAAMLIREAADAGLAVEGVSFHVGSQCKHFDNYAAALNIASHVLNDARREGHDVKILDIGGGFPVPYDAQAPRLQDLAALINAELVRLFPDEVEVIAEPGRFMVATAAALVTEIIGKARRDGKIFYHINDGLYHTFSGVLYDHWIPNFHAFEDGPQEVCAVVGPTCDSFDKITLSVMLPSDLEVGDYLYTENIGAYSVASSTRFNGFEGARILHRR